MHNFAEQWVVNNIVDSASCWAHLSEELDWSVAEPGTLVEVDLLRSVILRVLTSLERERSPSECVVPVQFFRLCRKRPWSTVDGEVLLQNLYTIAHCACGDSTRLAAEVLVSGSVQTCVALLAHWAVAFPAIQDDPTTQRRRFAAQRAAENASRCGEEAKRRTQLDKKTEDEQRPSG